MNFRIGVVMGLLALGLQACDSGPPNASPAVRAKVPKTRDEAAPRDACQHYQKALCEMTGGETSEVCRSIGTLEPYLAPVACVRGLSDLAFTEAEYQKPRAVCREVSERVCLEFGEDTDSCKRYRVLSKAWPLDHCEREAQQYDQTVARLREYEDKQRSLTPDERAKVLVAPAATLGPDSAPVQIVMFADFQCPFSAQTSAALRTLTKKYPEAVRIVFRNFPVGLHEHAPLAAEAALEAASQGRFWEFSDVLFHNQLALAPADLERHASAAGLDLARFERALSSHSHKPAVDADIALGRSINVGGTPTLFINGKRFRIQATVESLSAAVEQALATAKRAG